MNDPQIDAAYAARQAGDDRKVMDICRGILAANAAHLGARSLIGVCFAEAGDLDRARLLIEQPAAFEPGNWRFQLNLSVLREIEGNPAAAKESAEAAAAAAPERFETWARLGDLSGKQGDFEGAVAALDKAVAISGHPGLALRLAGAAYETGRHDKAAQALDLLERAAPGHPEALRLRTHLARKSGDQGAFVAAAAKWLEADPASEAARVALAHGHAQQDDYHRAVQLYRPLVQGQPDNAGHAATFARYLLWARDFDGAEAHYERALALEPGNADAAAGLARLNIYRGRLEQAAILAGKAVEADPLNVDAYGQLALASDSRLSDEQLARLHAIAADPATDPEQRASALFTAGDVHHRRKAHDRAFDAWRQANEIKRHAAVSAGSGYERGETEALVDRLIASFRDFPATAPAGGVSGPTPIFIVGMPRSGTTLLDSALAARADTSSGGELPAMPFALNRFLAWAQGSGWRGGPIPDQVAAQLRAGYLRQYADYGIKAAAFVTDKQPLNILSVGLIRHLFPAAPIIHIRRDAVETGFSIYRKNFTRTWTFSTALPDIGHYYGQYARLMAHWHEALGDRLALVNYEALVGDFEGELRRLTAQFGLAWDPAALAYHEQKSVVTTLSATQVRKPPSREYMSSTAPYAEALAPLRDALGEAGV